MMRQNSYLGLREVELSLVMTKTCDQLYNDGGGSFIEIVIFLLFKFFCLNNCLSFVYSLLF